ncbi:MAG: secondary thiamine-phosphate synthase enzyme YjbQ [Firmicutes bacterium]|nr:secondary thiamine-phosphate synthase enzyme YjbQ [Bacillota bacterium]
MWHEHPIQTKSQTEFVDLTHLVWDAVREWGLQEGLCFVFVPHTTAGVTINENADPDVMADFERSLAEMVPKIPFHHTEGNSPAHIKASLVGSSVVIPVEESRPLLGTWQGVYLCEFDGPRRRRVLIGCLEARPGR